MESSLLIDIDPRKEKGIRASCLACLLASKIFLSESIERFCYLFLFLPEDRRKGNRVKAATLLQLIELEELKELKEFFLLGEGR